MIIKCTNCGSRYRVSDDLVADGPKKFKCKKCEAVLLIKPPTAAAGKPSEKTAPAPEPQKQTPDAAEQPAPAAAADEQPAVSNEQAPQDSGEEQPDENENGADGTDEAAGASEDADQDNSNLSPEELAAQQQQDIQEKLEKRRQQMEDEISGRLNKAALETLDFEVLSELATKIQEIQHNPDFHADPETKLFSCIKCQTTFCIYPEDARTCSNCAGEVALVRGDDILKQYGMFG